MCGRYSLIAPARLASAYPRFKLGAFAKSEGPRYNIAPTQPVLGVRNDGANLIDELRWSLHGRINVRVESLTARGPIARRCVLFADGFYEWRDGTPVQFTLDSGAPFALAGIWEASKDAPPCAIVTCEPNDLVRPVHNRMPVIVPDDALELWLSPEYLPDPVARAILRPFDAKRMRARDVSKRLNNARHDAADVLRDDDPVQQSLGL